MLKVAVRSLPLSGFSSVRVGVYLGEVMMLTPVCVCNPSLLISVCGGTVEDGVPFNDHCVWQVLVGFLECHDVDGVLLHVLDDGVELGCLF